MGSGLEILAEKKLSILHYCKSFNMPITNAQIVEFYLNSSILNYFDLQQYLNELLSSKLLNYIDVNDRHYYVLTPEGIQALDILGKKLTRDMALQIDKFAKQNRTRFKDSSQVATEYLGESDEGNFVSLKLFEGNEVLLEVKLNIPGREQSMVLSEAWKSRAPLVYQRIIETLVEE